MSKFLLTGCLLVLLASFLNYPTESANLKQVKSGIQGRIIFPLNEQVKVARLEKRLTTKELSTKAGIPKMNIELIEKGQIIPSHAVVKKLEMVLQAKLNMNSY
jgi:ribosome-binding protein aMBF1 (putative translation factor)